MNKRPLGRGLSALISTGPQLADNDEVREIEVDLICPGSQQPRTTFDQAKLEELAQSIRSTGVIQPLLVRLRGGLKGWNDAPSGSASWRSVRIGCWRTAMARGANCRPYSCSEYHPRH